MTCLVEATSEKIFYFALSHAHGKSRRTLELDNSQVLEVGTFSAATAQIYHLYELPAVLLFNLPHG